MLLVCAVIVLKNIYLVFVPTRLSFNHFVIQYRWKKVIVDISRTISSLKEVGLRKDIFYPCTKCTATVRRIKYQVGY